MSTPIPAAALAQHIAILGKTGSGKTTTAKLAIEQVVADGARVCVLDPIKSDWWGLTSSADGKRPGLPFNILGGPRGHVPLHASAGKAIAEIVASGALPLSIIDMADFAPGGQAHFFVDFAPMLIRKMRGVIYLVIEEAHLFAPKERSGVGAENLSIHWAKMLATAGRSKGIRLILVTQRTQALHNALLGSCDTIIAHRLTAPADQAPVINWLKANVTPEIRDQVAGSISSLKTGHAWLCSGEARIFERVEFPRPRTYDNTATPEGDGELQTVKTAPVDQEKLRAIIGDAVKEAEASDPKLLRARIAELERAMHKKAPAAAPAAPDGKSLEAAEQRGFERGCALGIEAQNALLASLRFEFESVIDFFKGKYQATLQNARAQKPPTVTIHPQSVKRAPETTKAIGTMVRHAAAASSAQLQKGEAQILRALIQFPDGLRREQLTVLTTFARSTRDRYLQYLNAKGMLEQRGDLILASDAGRAALPDAEPLPTGPDLRAHWQRQLPPGEWKILEVLIEVYPDAIDRDALSDRVGQARSTRDRYLQYMRNKQLIEEPTRGEVRASETLF